MGIPALSIQDELIGGLAGHLTAAGFSATERTPPPSDVADRYIDCHVGQELVKLCLQPNPRVPGWHVLTFPGRRSGRSFQAVLDQLIECGAIDGWPKSD